METEILTPRSRNRKPKKKKIIGLICIIIGLGIVFGVGSGFVLAYLAEDAAATAVDNAVQLLEDLTTQEKIDAAQEAWSKPVKLVEDLREGAVQEELSQRLENIQKTIAKAQEALDLANARLAAEEAAAQAVQSVRAALEELTTQEQIDAATLQYQNACTLVEELHAGGVKEKLLEQLTEIDTLLAEAQELLDAGEAARASVAKVEGLLADLSSQSLVNKANSAYKKASKLVEALPAGGIRDQLEEQLAEILEVIDAAQEELYRKAEAAATEAVEKAEALTGSLSTQGAVNTAKSAYNSANSRVKGLHSGPAKDSLTTRIKAVKSAIDKAQGKIDALWAQVRLNFNSKHYTYNNLVNDIQKLVDHYPDLAKKAVVGKSVEGKDIWSITIGKGSKDILIIGSLHASEWITTPVLMRTVETLLWDYGQEISVNGDSVKSILDRYSLTFIPMANPDGVILVQQGADAYPHRKEELLARNSAYGDDFSRWKANIRGVDLNRNFDVPEWWTQPEKTDYPDPNYAHHPGSSPESEPETRAVANWIRNNQPELFLDYHSFGEILYWWNLQSQSIIERDRKIVSAMRSYSAYRMESIDYSVNPSATSIFWSSKVMKIPSITVELGNRSPRLLGMGDVSSIFSRVRYLPLIAIQKLPGY